VSHFQKRHSFANFKIQALLQKEKRAYRRRRGGSLSGQEKLTDMLKSLSNRVNRMPTAAGKDIQLKGAWSMTVANIQSGDLPPGKYAFVSHQLSSLQAKFYLGLKAERPWTPVISRISLFPGKAYGQLTVLGRIGPSCSSSGGQCKFRRPVSMHMLQALDGAPLLMYMLQPYGGSSWNYKFYVTRNVIDKQVTNRTLHSLLLQGYVRNEHASTDTSGDTPAKISNVYTPRHSERYVASFSQDSITTVKPLKDGDVVPAPYRSAFLFIDSPANNRLNRAIRYGLLKSLDNMEVRTVASGIANAISLVAIYNAGKVTIFVGQAFGGDLGSFSRGGSNALLRIDGTIGSKSFGRWEKVLGAVKPSNSLQGLDRALMALSLSFVPKKPGQHDEFLVYRNSVTSELTTLHGFMPHSQSSLRIKTFKPTPLLYGNHHDCGTETLCGLDENNNFVIIDLSLSLECADVEPHGMPAMKAWRPWNAAGQKSGQAVYKAATTISFQGLGQPWPFEVLKRRTLHEGQEYTKSLICYKTGRNAPQQKCCVLKTADSGHDKVGPAPGSNDFLKMY